MSIQSLNQRNICTFVPGGGVVRKEHTTVIVPKPYTSIESMRLDSYITDIRRKADLLEAELQELVHAFALPKDSNAAILLRKINED